MGVAMREDGGTVGVFSPKKVTKPLLKNRWMNKIQVWRDVSRFDFLMPLCVGLSQSSATALESLSLCLSTQSACFPPMRFVGCGVSFSGSSVVFLLFLLRVKSNLMIPIQQQLIQWQATWKPKCQKFCCGAVGRLYLHVFFLESDWHADDLVFLHVFIIRIPLSRHLIWWTSTKILWCPSVCSTTLKTGSPGGFRSSYLICGPISEWFGFSLVDFT